MNPERLQLERIDTTLRDWACGLPAKEEVYPVLIGDDTLHRAEYDRAFPHLLMSAAASAAPGGGDLQPAGYYLSPAVCYHAYAAVEGRELQLGVTLTARGRCFRNEETAQLRPGRRQIEFEMREVVFIGTREWIEEELAPVMEDVSGLADSFGMEGAWEPASDPFFLPSSEGRAAMQRLLGTKLEYCLPEAGGLAVASINRHGTFFGERFRITAGDERPAHTACVAFGLDRWAAHAARHREISVRNLNPPLTTIP
jgi:seryl-tRNA synthetase